MSVFRRFKLPQLIQRGSPGSEVAKEIPRFKCSELPVKQRIVQGSFGDVYTTGTTEYKSSGDTKCHTVVIKPTRLNCYKHSFFVRIVKLWNELLGDIVEADSFQLFKS